MPILKISAPKTNGEGALFAWTNKQAQIFAEGCEEEYISFKFTASISSVHKHGFTRVNEVKRYQMGSNLAKLDQAGPNRNKHFPNRVKQGQTGLKRLKGVKAGKQG